ncbi:MAG: DNA adenine methylase, partial [Bacteroidota bacterium]
MSGNRSKQIAFNYFGGKFTFTEKLIDHFPQHEHFVDVFCGSMAVTLNKPSSGIETANDINGNVINFFKVLREEPAELIRALSLTPVSRQEYDECWPISEGESALELARRFYVRVKQSYLGLCAQRKNKGWLHSSRNSRTKVAELVSKWFNGIEGLPMLVYRLQSIQIENQDFRRLIPRIDYPEAFFYCDPPYPKES